MIRRPPRSTRTEHSFPTRRSSDLVTPALLRASKAMPAVMAPSPITAMCWRSIPRLRDATAIPSTAEIDVDECAVPKASYSDSARLGKPEIPPACRRRSEEHTSELQSLMRISYDVFCLKKKTHNYNTTH